MADFMLILVLAVHIFIPTAVRAGKYMAKHYIQRFFQVPCRKRAIRGEEMGREGKTCDENSKASYF